MTFNMSRRNRLGLAFAVGICAMVLGGLMGLRKESPPSPQGIHIMSNHEKVTKTPAEIEKTDAEWRASLSPEEYHVTREKGTERAFSGKYWNNKADGTYTCVCCGTPLFESKTKFDSGTGWPSFYEPVDEQIVETESDNSFFMTRTEAMCHKCKAHLGHVFDDGPQPTGLRYCINSASLKFEKKSD